MTKAGFSVAAPRVLALGAVASFGLLAFVGAAIAQGDPPTTVVYDGGDSVWDNLVVTVPAILGTGSVLGWLIRRWFTAYLDRQTAERKQTADDLARKHAAEIEEQRAAREDQRARLDDLKNELAVIRAQNTEAEQRIRSHYEREVADWKAALADERQRSERFFAILWERFPHAAAEVRREVVTGIHTAENAGERSPGTSGG